MVAKLYICYIQSLRCLNTVNFDALYFGSCRSNFVHLKKLNQTQNCSAPYLSCHPSLSSPASASTRASYIPAASSSLRNLVFRLPLMSANCNRWFKYVKGLTLVYYQYIYCTGYICMYEGLGWTGVPDLLLMWFASAAHHQQLGSADMNRTCFGDRDMFMAQC